MTIPDSAFGPHGERRLRSLPELDPVDVSRVFAPQFEACEDLLATVWENRPQPPQIGEPYQFLLANILGRSLLTFRATLHLCRGGYDQQALMLTRSLFEDFIVGCWCAVPENREDAYYRLTAKDEAQGLEVNDFLRSHPELVNLEPLTFPDVEARRSEFKRLFEKGGGLFIGRSLWTAIKEISGYWESLGASADDLWRYYHVIQRLANSQLHVTARGLTEQLKGTGTVGGIPHFEYGARPRADEERTVTTLRAAAFSVSGFALVVFHGLGVDTECLAETQARSNLAFTDLTPANLRTVGRNEPCPCGSGRKFKHCHEFSSGG